MRPEAIALAVARGRGSRRFAVGVGLAMYALVAAAPVVAGPQGYMIDFNALLVVDTANPSIVARVPLGGLTTATPVVDPRGARVYVVVNRMVANQPSPPGAADDVAVVDTASRTVVSTIPVRFPREALLRPQGDRLYVTTQETVGVGVSAVSHGGVSVIDTATNAIVSAPALAASVGHMAVDRSGARLYVVLEETFRSGPRAFSLAMLEGSSGTVLATIPLPGLSDMPFVVVVHPDGSAVYVADRRDVLVVDTASGFVHTVVLPSAPPLMFRERTALAVDPTGEFVLAFGKDAAGTEVNGTHGFMVVIDAHTALAVGEVSLPLIPEVGAVHPDGRAFVAGRPLGACGARPTGCSKASAGVAVVDLATRQLVGLVDTGPAADAGVTGIPPKLSDLAPPVWVGVEVHPDRASVYVAERNGRVSVLDAATGAIIAQLAGAGIALGTGPPPVPGSQQVYVVPSSGLPPAAFALGAPGDHPVPRDYDGDGRVDLAVWRPREGGEEGLWFIRRSSDGVVVRQAWGAVAYGDVPVPADYDGDGRADVAVWRPFQGGWCVVRSSDGSALSQPWGGFGDVPVPADYDGDGRADLAIWRPGVGQEPAHLVHPEHGRGALRDPARGGNGRAGAGRLRRRRPRRPGRLAAEHGRVADPAREHRPCPDRPLRGNRRRAGAGRLRR